MYRAWMDKVKVGSVLKYRGGYRVVRSVSHHKDGRLRCVYFTIKHCSWTSRCYTVMNYSDLDYLGYSLTGMTYKLNAPLDAKIKHELGADRKDKQLDCCDVRGIA
jgi:hypothetical protein